MSPFTKGTFHKQLYQNLDSLHSQKGIYLFNETLRPLQLLNPDQVKVVILVKEPINGLSTPYAFTEPNGKLNKFISEALKDQKKELIAQRFEKFTGTVYSTLRRNETNDKWKDKNLYWKIRGQKEQQLNYVGVLGNPPFDTFNWYRQGVLTLNMNWTGSPGQPDHSDLWRAFGYSLIFNLQKNYERIVFACAESALHDYANIVSTSDTEGGDHRLVFQDGIENFFTNINKALTDLHGPRLMINFLVDEFNRRGHTYDYEHEDSPQGEFELRRVNF